MIRDGSVFLRDLESDSLRQLWRPSESVSNLSFSADGLAIHFRDGQRWLRMELESGLAIPVADLRMSDAPHSASDNTLEPHQLRLFETLERERRRRQQRFEEAVEDARVDSSRGPAPWYLGDSHQIVTSSLSSDGRWLLAVVEKSDAGEGKTDRMPQFVTRSGYVEVEDVRTLVGRDAPAPQSLWLLDLETRSRQEIDLSTLQGRDQDPLTELKKKQQIEPYDSDNPRPVRITGIEWHPKLARSAIQVRAIDNKDRWTLIVEAESASTEEIHRLNDPAWINWAFNEFGWVPNSEIIWLLSEQSGYSHLYTREVDGEILQRTSGNFEVFDVRFSANGWEAWMITNRTHPIEYDVYWLGMNSGELARLSELGGVEEFRILPGSNDLLIRHSSSYTPSQAIVMDIKTGTLQAPTDTRTEHYKSIDWQQPMFVGIPSTHGVLAPIWSKFYPARGDQPGSPRPAVLFVHGAGYTQNTHQKFPYYFREQMFHNLLTERGYHVLDMDYRASRGYGRAWRTAIYRQMGTPELEDLIDGVDWLVNNHNVDPERIGVYGGSYGGFMTFMALFNAPETFAAGAALRPVTDWVHYNHGYTSNILNTPEVDPEAYRRSSPIEFAENLEGHLLISHGMLDDNVFYKDSVRLAQRLIELKKRNWELASYPLEPHGYEQPESWLDQYRRILKLFETTIGASR
ncbi:MAG: prolyl oligopeptidase family serine peptidase [Xanthomonadaceae bacterium]|nr:prolyl oligopeptidase family serine peptidase [Xanthomonadaceae bacterium]